MKKITIPVKTTAVVAAGITISCQVIPKVISYGVIGPLA